LRLDRVDLPIDRLRSVELPPFEAAVRAGVASIMTAHVVYPALDRNHPATMSHAAIDGILRKEMGFDGVVVADDLEMKAIADHFSLEESLVLGLNAGVDLFLICHTPTKQKAAVEIIAKAVADGAFRGSGWRKLPLALMRWRSDSQNRRAMSIRPACWTRPSIATSCDGLSRRRRSMRRLARLPAPAWIRRKPAGESPRRAG